jgi:hypothetical protein
MDLIKQMKEDNKNFFSKEQKKCEENGTMEISTSHGELGKINENGKDSNHEADGTSDRGGK